MSEQPGYTYWECRDCCFDAVTLDSVMDRTPICPLCAGDSGRDVEMHGRVARSDDKVEGKDARPTLPAAMREGGENG
jgi:hypothetical protein